eukprot:s556_g27.t1
MAVGTRLAAEQAPVATALSPLNFLAEVQRSSGAAADFFNRLLKTMQPAVAGNRRQLARALIALHPLPPFLQSVAQQRTTWGSSWDDLTSPVNAAWAVHDDGPQEPDSPLAMIRGETVDCNVRSSLYSTLLLHLVLDACESELAELPAAERQKGLEAVCVHINEAARAEGQAARLLLSASTERPWKLDLQPGNIEQQYSGRRHRPTRAQAASGEAAGRLRRVLQRTRRLRSWPPTASPRSSDAETRLKQRSEANPVPKWSERDVLTQLVPDLFKDMFKVLEREPEFCDALLAGVDSEKFDSDFGLRAVAEARKSQVLSRRSPTLTLDSETWQKQWKEASPVLQESLRDVPSCEAMFFVRAVWRKLTQKHLRLQQSAPSFVWKATHEETILESRGNGLPEVPQWGRSAGRRLVPHVLCGRELARGRAVSIPHAAQYRFHTYGHRALAETMVARVAEQVRDLIRLDQDCQAQRSTLMRRLEDTRQRLDEITNTVEMSARPKSLPRSLARSLAAVAASASASTAAGARADTVAAAAAKDQAKFARHENEESEEETADEATVPTTEEGGDAPGGTAGDEQASLPPHAASGIGAAPAEPGPQPAELPPPGPPEPTPRPKRRGRRKGGRRPKQRERKRQRATEASAAPRQRRSPRKRCSSDDVVTVEPVTTRHAVAVRQEVSLTGFGQQSLAYEAGVGTATERRSVGECGRERTEWLGRENLSGPAAAAHGPAAITAARQVHRQRVAQSHRQRVAQSVAHGRRSSGAAGGTTDVVTVETVTAAHALAVRQEVTLTGFVLATDEALHHSGTKGKGSTAREVGGFLLADGESLIQIALWGDVAKRWFPRLQQWLDQAEDAQFPQVEITACQVSAYRGPTAPQLRRLQSTARTTLRHLDTAPLVIAPSAAMMVTSATQLMTAPLVSCFQGVVTRVESLGHTRDDMCLKEIGITMGNGFEVPVMLYGIQAEETGARSTSAVRGSRAGTTSTKMTRRRPTRQSVAQAGRGGRCPLRRHQSVARVPDCGRGSAGDDRSHGHCRGSCRNTRASLRWFGVALAYDFLIRRFFSWFLSNRWRDRQPPPASPERRSGGSAWGSLLPLSAANFNL